MEEELKTIQEITKLGTKALDIGGKFSGFLSRVFGELTKDLVGIAGGDHLHHARIRNIEKLEQRTNAILEERGINNDSAPLSPNIALPLLSAAQNESREGLQELWARMLANAMDPNRSSAVRQLIIDTVQKFDPLDAKVLETASNITDPTQYTQSKKVLEKLKVTLSEFEVSLKNLEDSDCIMVYFAGSSNSNKKNIEETPTFRITHLGREILRACSP